VLAIEGALLAIGGAVLRAAGRTDTRPSGPDESEWIGWCSASADHRTLRFTLRRRFGNPAARAAFGPLRCTVTEPDGVTTWATEVKFCFAYPRDFAGAPQLRPGWYRFAWEGLSARGVWLPVTSGVYHARMPAPDGG
jgi:hypothetical protein